MPSSQKKNYVFVERLDGAHDIPEDDPDPDGDGDSGSIGDGNGSASANRGQQRSQQQQPRPLCSALVVSSSPEEMDPVVVTGGPSEGLRGRLICVGVDGADSVLEAANGDFRVVDYSRLAKVEEDRGCGNGGGGGGGGADGAAASASAGVALAPSLASKVQRANIDLEHAKKSTAAYSSSSSSLCAPSCPIGAARPAGAAAPGGMSAPLVAGMFVSNVDTTDEVGNGGDEIVCSQSEGADAGAGSADISNVNVELEISPGRPSEVRRWLRTVDEAKGTGGRLEARYSDAFESHFFSVDNLRRAADKYGVDRVLECCGVDKLGDMVCLDNTITELL